MCVCYHPNMNKEVMQLRREIWTVMKGLVSQSEKDGRTFNELYNRIREVIGDEEKNQLAITELCSICGSWKFANVECKKEECK